MAKENFNDLHAFLLVAREGSFTKAAALLGVSQSALSHTVRGLEERLGMRLLTRSTRSVSPTTAGERLLLTIAPRFEEIKNELAALSDLREKPAGTVRITTSDHAADSILWPKLAEVLRQYPDIVIEMTLDNSLVDIVAERYDVGVRLGEQVAKDMIAVPIGPAMRMLVVGTPDYLADKPEPLVPQDLLAHQCINFRLPTYGGLYAWEFERDGREINLRVEGQLIFNGVREMLRASLAGFGLAYLPEDLVLPYIADGRLVQLLDDWCPVFPGFHIYYTSRHHSSPALSVVINALRYDTRDDPRR